MPSINKVLIDYEFKVNGGKEEWTYSIFITPDLLDEYYGCKAVHKDLFCFLDFDRLVDENIGFLEWLKAKFYDDAKEEFERYYL